MASVDPATLRDLAESISLLAKRIESHADDMEAFRIPALSLAMGNWKLGYKYLEGWFTNQLSKTLMVAAEKEGLMTRVTIERPH